MHFTERLRVRRLAARVAAVSAAILTSFATVAAPSGAAATNPAATGATQTLTQPIKTPSGTTIGTYTMTITTYLTDVVVAIPSTEVQLPAGTYELESCASATLSNSIYGSTCPQETTVAVATQESVTLPPSSIVVSRTLSGAANVAAGWDGVLVNRAGSWVTYATSWQGLGQSGVVVPAIDPAIAATNPSGTYPTQSLSQAIKTTAGATIGTYTMRATTRETDEVATIPAATVQLPAGTYQLESCIGAAPGDNDNGSPCPQKTQVTLTAAGSATIPGSSVIATRSLTGSTDSVQGWDGVLVNRNGTWVTYATSWQGLNGSAIPVPAVTPGRTTQLYGSNSLVIRSDDTGLDHLVDISQEDTELAALAAQGAQVVRTNLNWAFLEPQRGSWDPATVLEFDQYFAEADALGLKVITDVGSTPCWASSASAAVRNGCSSSLNGAGYPPADYSDRTAALQWMMQRWGHSIYGVETWNEPEGTTTGHPLCNNGYWDASTYAKLLQNTYSAVKSVNPSIIVAAGTLAMPDTTYLDCLYNTGIQGSYDVIDVHPYQVDMQETPQVTGDPIKPFPLNDPADDSIEVGMENLRADMLAHSDSSPVWITETGFSTCQGAALCATPSQQAQWLSETFKMAARWNFVSVALSYNASDTGASTTTWGDNFGLMSNGLVPKPALAAVGQTWSCLHAGTC
jgi:hypothetical protein